MKIITREEIGYAVPRSSIPDMPTPSPRSWLHHIAAAWHRPPTWTERNFKRKMFAYLREVEAFHRSKGWTTIAYSLIVWRPVFRRVVVLEGRGKGKVGAHTRGDNSGSHAVCLIGNYETQRIPRRMMKKLRRLFDFLVDDGWVEKPRRNHPTGGHRDAPGAATACPGRYAYARLSVLRKRWRPWRVTIVKDGEVVKRRRFVKIGPAWRFARRNTPNLRRALGFGGKKGKKARIRRVT